MARVIDFFQLKFLEPFAEIKPLAEIKPRRGNKYFKGVQIFQ